MNQDGTTALLHCSLGDRTRFPLKKKKGIETGRGGGEVGSRSDQETEEEPKRKASRTESVLLSKVAKESVNRGATGFSN